MTSILTTIKELKSLAEKASVIISNGKVATRVIIKLFPEDPQYTELINKYHIAANPATILLLIDAIEEMKQILEEDTPRLHARGVLQKYFSNESSDKAIGEE